jgi:hypothetical protein
MPREVFDRARPAGSVGRCSVAGIGVAWRDKGPQVFDPTTALTRNARSIPGQLIAAPYTLSTIIVMSSLRSETMTDRYSSQSGCSPAAMR